MDLLDSEKLKSFREKYFDHAKKHFLFENVLKTNGNIVFGKGSDNPRIVFIGEAPGKDENRIGIPFVGRSGKLLDNWINSLGLSKKDFCIINVVPIIPLSKEGLIRPPNDEEINYFLPFTEEYLGLLDPEIVVLLGRSAASIFDKTLRVGETKNVGKYNLFFIYHPSYYLRNGGKGFELVLEKLKNFLESNKKNNKQFKLNDF